MSSSSLESEDLENANLVAMEDIQPSGNRILGSSSHSQDLNDGNYEDCVMDNLEFDHECVIQDDSSNTSNIGSMVVVKVEGSPDNAAEMIVPEILEFEVPIFKRSCLPEKEIIKQEPMPEKRIKQEQMPEKQMNQEQMPEKQINQDPIRTANNLNDTGQSWPTLEILPGGVIRNYDKYNETLDADLESETMVFACAKCSERFRHLFSLTQHVRLHTEEERRLKEEAIPKVVIVDKKKYETIAETRKNKYKNKRRSLNALKKLLLPIRTAKTKLRKRPKRIHSKS